MNKYRIVDNADDIFAMSKLTKKLADRKRAGRIEDFIYFSPVNGPHGPRIKFCGGTAETNTTQSSPSYGFSIDGPTKVYLKDWMNKKNCPNAFDEEYLENIRQFISKNLSILLLVWYNKLDEADALTYLQGNFDFTWLKNQIQVDLSLQDSLEEIQNLHELHTFCKLHNLYR